MAMELWYQRNGVGDRMDSADNLIDSQREATAMSATNL